MVTESDIKRFQKLFTARYGVKLTRDEAYGKLCLLLRQMELIYQPITLTQLKSLADENSDGDTDEAGLE